MPKTVAVIAAALGLTAIAAPAMSQTLLDKLLAKATWPKATAAGAAGAAPAANSGAFIAAITPAQQAAVDRLLSAPLQDQRIAADRADAKPLIVKLLGIGACGREPAAWNAINRDSLTPTTYGNFDLFRVAMYDLRYHDKNGCLDVARLADWSKPALNALKFRAYYIAGDSGEAKSQSFELQKNGEGVWMVRTIGAASV